MMIETCGVEPTSDGQRVCILVTDDRHNSHHYCTVEVLGAYIIHLNARGIEVIYVRRTVNVVLSV